MDKKPQDRTVVARNIDPLQRGFLAILAGVAALYVFREGVSILAPILSAMVLGIVLSPVTRAWEKAGLPTALSAFLSVSFAILILVAIILALEPFVSEVINRAPIIWFEMRETVQGLQGLLRGIDEITEDVAAVVDPTGAAESSDEPILTVPTITDALFYAPAYAAQSLIFAGTLYFFLLTRSEFYVSLGRFSETLSSARLFKAERQVSRYFLTITTINACLGVLVAIAMQLLGLGAAPLWGFMAFLLNFIMYLGPISLIGMLAVAGIVAFDGAFSIAPALVYMVINGIEAQFVTPTLVGKSMAVNPLFVFVSLVFWLWLWGPIGGIIAIPLLVWTSTVLNTDDG